MKKSLFSVLFLLVAMVCLSLSAMAEGFNNEVRKSVAVIATYVEYQNPRTQEILAEGLLGSGTCFFIGAEGEDPEYLLTNYHVISEYAEFGKGEWTRVALQDGSGYVNERVTLFVFYSQNEREEAYLVSNAYDEGRDIALLRLERPTDKRKPLTLQRPTQEMVGNTVYAVGYPGTSENELASPKSMWGIDDATVTDGIISRLVTSEHTGIRLIQMTADIQHGHSGSPLINSQGYAIGINAWDYTVSRDESGLDVENAKYAINIEEAIAMLDQNNIKYILADGASLSGGSGSRQAEDTQAETSAAAETTAAEETSTSSAETETGSGSNYLPYVIGGIAAVLILAAVVLLLRRKKSPGAGSTQGEAASIPRTASTAPGKKQQEIPVARSMASQHHGESVSLRGHQILIGGDATAKIIFSKGTPGVSRRHCTLSYDEARKEFILTDLQSTYGTFLSNGQKLEGNVEYRLKSGDSFYLGSKENTIRVELAAL